MGFYNIFVASQCNLLVKDSQLTINNGKEQQTYPLEDINSLMIENLATNLSSYALSKLADYGILTFVCNSSHLPCGVILPFCEYYQTLLVYNNQVDMPKPLGKRLWSSIIKNKIENQNEVLNICGGKDRLKALQKSVLSGDANNNEAKASHIYFKELFGAEFARRKEGKINDFLNYGYSILRGFVARCIVSHGLMPFLGIFHCNQFNQFNLADDLMEIFRPIVDLYVKVYLTDEDSLSTKIKSELFNIVNYDVLVDGQRQTVSYAIELLVQSFVKSLKEKTDALKKITIIGLELHQYE